MASELRRSRAALSLLLAFSMFSGVALGQPAATEEAKKTARNLMAEGRTLRDEGKDLKGALDAFRKAHSIMKVPTTGIEVARTLMLMSKFVEAQEEAQQVAAIPVAPKEPPPFGHAREEALKLAAEAGSKIAFIKLDIKGLPAGKTAEVTVDGLSVAPDAIKEPLKQNPGKHTVVIKGPSTRTFDVELEEGGSKDIAVDFKPAPEKKDEAPPPPPPSEPGEQPSRLMRPLPLIGFGLAGAGLVAGGITGLLAMSKGSAAKDKCVDNKCPNSAHDDVNSGKSMATISNISFAVAGVGAVVGVIGYMQDPKPAEKKEAKAGVSPYLGLGEVGLTGRFLGLTPRACGSKTSPPLPPSPSSWGGGDRHAVSRRRYSPPHDDAYGWGHSAGKYRRPRAALAAEACGVP